MDLTRLGYDESLRVWFSGLDAVGAVPARVARVDRGAVVLLTADGSRPLPGGHGLADHLDRRRV